MTAPMSATVTDASVEARLDAIAAQLADVAEELRVQREVRERWQELAAELTPVSRGALDVLTRELDDLAPDVGAEEMAHFLRTFVRAMPKLEVLLAQLESVVDLVGELTSLGGAGMQKLSDTLDAAQRQGYFALAAAARRGADGAVAALAAEDLERLAAAGPQMARSLAPLLQAPVLERLSAVAVSIEQAEHVADTPSTLQLLRRLRDPETRRGLARLLLLLRAFGADPASPATER